MKVNELGMEIGKRDDSNNGLKKILQDRLIATMSKKKTFVQDKSTDEPTTSEEENDSDFCDRPEKGNFAQ